MSTVPRPFLTPEQYLEIDRRAEVNSEYYNGEMFEMAGGSFPHAVLHTALSTAVRSRIDRKNCLSVSSNMRIQVSATGLYTYPDFAVVCGTPQLADGHRDTLLNPVLIAEVLSPSTASYDRAKKFEHYRTIESLRHYVLVSQETMLVEVFTVEAGRLNFSAASDPGELVRLPEIGVEFPVEELYEGLDVSEALRLRPPKPSSATT
jgi:Uma2 family endonuclease